MSTLEKVKAEYLGKGNVIGVGTGFRQRAGRRTDEACVVAIVDHKYTLSELKQLGMMALESMVDGTKIDIQARERIVAPRPILRSRSVGPKSLVARIRPPRPGCSIGSFRITAGTFGFAAYKDGELVYVSNNHVFADSNAGVTGDRIVQPGKYDGGMSENDTVCLLGDFGTIDFGGGGQLPPSPCLEGCQTNAGRKRLAAIQRGLDVASESMRRDAPDAAFFAQMVRMGLDAAVAANRLGARAIPQEANYVDTAYGNPFGPKPDPTFLLINRKWETLVEAKLGDPVEKVGRTTEHTKGRVTMIDATIQVDYGPAGVATFEDQIGIETDDGSEFSAGGDSGSAILYDGSPALTALLFAGGGGQTFANRIHRVFTTLGLSQTAP